MPPRAYIADLAPNQLVEGVFSIQNAQLGLTKNGKPYLKCLLADRTGRTPGRMWSASEELIQSLPTNGFVFIEGQTQAYQGEIQIIIREIHPTTPSETDLQDLMPSTEHDIDDMFNSVRRRIESLSSPALRALAQTYLQDEDLMSRFRRAPAAVQLHHAYLGGLLEHTLSLMKLAEAVLPLYPELNAEIVTFGLFLHDLGKCHELSWDTGFSYSDDGQLVGHVARGAIWLEHKAQAARAAGHTIPDALVTILQHIILSHHGVPEYGALKTPSTPEAILIHQLDNIDAKMNMSISAVRAEGPAADLGGNFTEKVWALGTRLYRPDPLAGEHAFAGERAKGADEAPPAPPTPTEGGDAKSLFGAEGAGRPTSKRRGPQDAGANLKGGLG